MDASEPVFPAGGVFTTLRILGGAPLFLEDHLERLERSAPAFRLACPGRAILAGEIARAAAGMEEARVRITLLEGPRRYVEADPYEPPVAPLRLRPVPTPVAGAAARLKTVARAGYRLARLLAGEADDALLVDEQGALLETTSANVFLADGRTLLTPDLGAPILPGVARARLLRLAPGLGFRVEERRIPLSEAGEWPECFVTNALLPIRSVAGVDGLPPFTGRAAAGLLREALVRAGRGPRIIP